ncbi:MAG: hypothetical protein LUD72_12090 [Bacteroidales bacterium]|nr:hypothetical protein [Bacteroidales bacterium]
MAVNDTFNDGVVTICREIKAASTFSARQGAVTWADLEHIVTMDFAESYKREQDSSYANQMGFRLDRKIVVRKPGNIKIDTECAAVIGTMLYHVSYTDVTPEKIYLSLTEVRELEAE